MIFEIYEGYTEEGNGSRKYAINPKLFKEEEEGHYPKPEDWFEPRFSHNITKLGEIKVEGDVDLLYDSFSVDGE